MPGATNAIIGDAPTMELPSTEIPQEQLTTEKRMAKFAKSDGYKDIVEHAVSRIEYYQHFLPDGTPIGASAPGQKASRPNSADWYIANIVIAEFKMILGAYEAAEKVVAKENA